MGRLSFFVSELPDVQIVDGHVYVHVGDMEFVLTVAVFRAILEREIAKLDAWGHREAVRREIDIVPLCKLCTRHNLPRDSADH